jgi:SpoVK/Ycf46/Vps4 family AAA+-type ATPase
MSGAQSSGVTDGGTGSRVLGTILTWLNDHTSDVFFVGTCNDVSQLLGSNPEFARAERFDGMFFFDLPTAEEREKIWNIYLKMFGITSHPPISQLVRLSENWTGAEIKSCCRLSLLQDVSLTEAAAYVPPLIDTAAERLGTLRNWASRRCLSTGKKGLFDLSARKVEIASTTVSVENRSI